MGVATLLSNKQVDLGKVVSEREQNAALSVSRHLLLLVVQSQAENFNHQELANILWSMAALGFGLSSSQDQSGNTYRILEGYRQLEDSQLMLGTVDVTAQSSIRMLPKFSAHRLSNVSWALSKTASKHQN